MQIYRLLICLITAYDYSILWGVSFYLKRILVSRAKKKIRNKNNLMVHAIEMFK